LGTIIQNLKTRNSIKEYERLDGFKCQGLAIKKWEWGQDALYGKVITRTSNCKRECSASAKCGGFNRVEDVVGRYCSYWVEHPIHNVTSEYLVTCYRKIPGTLLLFSKYATRKGAFEIKIYIN